MNFTPQKEDKQDKELENSEGTYQNEYVSCLVY